MGIEGTQRIHPDRQMALTIREVEVKGRRRKGWCLVSQVRRHKGFPGIVRFISGDDLTRGLFEVSTGSLMFEIGNGRAVMVGDRQEDPAIQEARFVYEASQNMAAIKLGFAHRMVVESEDLRQALYDGLHARFRRGAITLTVEELGHRDALERFAKAQPVGGRACG